MSKSTLAFKSNLQYLENTPRYDTDFLKTILDPGALLEIDNAMHAGSYDTLNYTFTDTQKKILQGIRPCKERWDDDYPHGIVRDAKGNIRVVCRCVRCLEEGCPARKQNNCHPDLNWIPESPEDVKDKLAQFDEAYEQAVELEKSEIRERLLIQQKKDAEKLANLESLPYFDESTKVKTSDISNEQVSAVDDYVFSRYEEDSDLKTNNEKPIDITGKTDEEFLSGIDTVEKHVLDINSTEPVADDNSEETYFRTDTDNIQVYEPVSNFLDYSSFKNVTQEYIETLPYEKRVIVNAGPGTGKTYTLIEKIKNMIEKQDVSPDEILVLCFSRAAVEVIKSRLENEAAEISKLGKDPGDWSHVDVRTFDSFGTALLSALMNADKGVDNLEGLLPEGYSFEGQGYNDRIQQVDKIFRTLCDHPGEYINLMGNYKHIIVDEVQDLVGDRADMVLSLLSSLDSDCGFTLLGDACQSIYDYQVKNRNYFNYAMSSNEFYQKLFDKFSDAVYVSLNENHRQENSDISGLTEQYRNAILSGNVDDCISETDRLNDSAWLQSKEPIRTFSVDDAKNYLQNGTLGILTRNNGQALRISAWLMKNGVEHRLQKPLGNPGLSEWIASVLLAVPDSDYEITAEQFRHIFSDENPGKADEWMKYWEALLGSLLTETKTHYEIEDILKKVMDDGRDPLLYKDPDEKDYPVTVSDVHRVKGREFDTVFLMNDIFPGKSNGQENNPYRDIHDIGEHKVCYVAMTRPKKNIKGIELSDDDKNLLTYIYISKDQLRRCFAGGEEYHKEMNYFEVGNYADINERSFAKSKEIQNYINSLHPDERLRLKRESNIEIRTSGRGRRNKRSWLISRNDIVKYNLFSENNPKIILGETSDSFYQDMFDAVTRMQNWDPDPGEWSVNFFPVELQDIYFDGRTTCISTNGEDLDGARKFGSIYLWKGIRIRGFARKVNHQ